MPDLPQRTLVSVRTKTCSQSSRATVYARAYQIKLGIPRGFDAAEPYLKGVEQMLGWIASGIIGLFIHVYQRRRLTVDRMEATAKAELASTLRYLGIRYLGVIGSTGTGSYENIQLKTCIDGLLNQKRCT